VPVLLDGTSVVVRLDAISERYSGFWPRFVDQAPNRTMCSDGELARVGFMDTRDADAFVEALGARGLVAESDGKAVDCVIVEQATGSRLPCPWLDRSVVDFEGVQVPVGRLVGGAATRIAVPNGWNPGSLLETDLQFPLSEVKEQLEYLRSEGMVDVYRHRVTGKILYTGRTTDKGRGRLGRMWDSWLHVLRSFAKARNRHEPGTAAAEAAMSPQDLEQVATSYRQQAEQGLAQAQYELGTMYTAGRGVTCDHVEAATWYRRAADQGLVHAQFVLGVMCSEGKGVPQDYEEAMAWFGRAADRGYDAAEVELGLIFYWGRRGMPQDYVAAASWFRRAADRGNAFAQQSLATQYRLGQGVTQDDSAAATWFRRAADQGHASAQFDLALLYVEGKSVPQDMVQAYMWFDLAARNYPPGKDRDDAVSSRTRFCRNLKRAQVAEAQRLVLGWQARKEANRLSAEDSLR